MNLMITIFSLKRTCSAAIYPDVRGLDIVPGQGRRIKAPDHV